VYRESDQLEPLIRTLIADPYPDKEIVVCVDEPTQKTEATIVALGDLVKFRVSSERLGKVAALNKAVDETPCDALLFLDSDVEVRQEGFVGRVVEEMGSFDLIEIKKKIIRDSFIARIVNYDALSANFTSFLFSKYLGRCLAFNGSAFAIKRGAWETLNGFGREICEDLDMATRTYIAGLRFGYANGTEIHSKVSPRWGVWVKQRGRWSAGQAHWLKRHYRMLVKSIFEHPKVLLTALLIIFPSLPMMAITFAFPDTLYVDAISFGLILFAGRRLFLMPPVVAMLLSVATLKAFTVVAILFTAFTVVFYYFARRLGYVFSLLEFAFFFFVYNPLWLTISIASLIRVIIWKNGLKLDWKI
jgi:cellulose synthase/poly-beta-1,6-N-acetylglucosamine synthase-like glycosyltransferase